MQMIVKLIRFSSQENSTLGLLYIDGNFQCFTIEDEFRTEKVMHETRIPEGIYELGIRDEGGFHERYKSKFKGVHKGMILLTNWVATGSYFIRTKPRPVRTSWNTSQHHGRQFRTEFRQKLWIPIPFQMSEVENPAKIERTMMEQ